MTAHRPAPPPDPPQRSLHGRSGGGAGRWAALKFAFGRISGQALNGGGRPEVQAAHIRPVQADGPDVVRNGLALSGTAHWMFDRGLISVDDDDAILTATDRLPPGAAQLLRPEGRLLLPEAARARPDRVYLDWHRREVFKG